MKIIISIFENFNKNSSKTRLFCIKLLITLSIQKMKKQTFIQIFVPP